MVWLFKGSKGKNPEKEKTPFMCSNSRFKTNTSKGHPHGSSSTRGSVFPEALTDSHGYTLWLEYVIDTRDNSEVFWFMWYGPNGRPTIAVSGVFNEVQLREMTGRLADFIKLPG